jgi:cbb3-type cytochrome oxidase maturation protein
LSLAIIFLLAFFWAHKNGQNDDLYTPSVRILFDDEISSDEKEKSSKV